MELTYCGRTGFARLVDNALTTHDCLARMRGKPTIRELLLDTMWDVAGELLGWTSKRPSWLTRRMLWRGVGWRNVVMPRPPEKRRAVARVSYVLNRINPYRRALLGPSITERLARKRRAFLQELRAC